MSNRKDLKAFVRYDGTGRIVPSSLILARKMPKVGDWKQIQAYECCDPNFPTTTTTSTSTPT
jgi:phospholipid N-methyltransferase